MRTRPHGRGVHWTRGAAAVLAATVALLAPGLPAGSMPKAPAAAPAPLPASADAPFAGPAATTTRPSDPRHPPFGGVTAAGTSSITIVVDAQPNSAQDFGFNSCSPQGCGPFTLDDDADPTLPAQITGTGLDAGTYTITQTAVAGWTLAALVCDTGESIDLANRRATVTLSAGEHSTCTFTDTSAAITIVLDAQPDSAQDFAFTGCGGGCAPFSLDDDSNATLPSQVTGAGLAPGTYTIAQAATSGWLLTALSCTTGESIDLATRTATVTLSAGERTTCTFKDETIPTLTVQTVVSGQVIPWDVNWTPDGSMLWTERGGSLNVLPPLGAAREITLAGNGDFLASNEIGLMGLAVDPAFAQNRRIYTCQGSSDGGQSIQVVVWTLDAGLTTATRVVDPLVGGIPMGSIHGGCRLEFTPDGYLMVTTGDAATGTNPQSLTSLGGKTLKVSPTTGAGAPTNTFATDGDPNTDARIYTRGHRNVQGLAIRPGLNQLWSVEHGPDIDDEVNLLQNGGNYGWNPVPGYNQSVPMTDLSIAGAIPAKWSSGSPTLATSGATFLTGSQWEAYRGFLAVATLKNSSLRMMGFDAAGTFVRMDTPAALNGAFGRLRTPAIGPDGALYVTTSNGVNDLILRVTPS